MTYIVNLNELTAFYLLALMAARRKVYILPVDPIVPPLRGVLQRFADWVVASKRAEWVIELCPELRPVWRGYSRAQFLVLSYSIR